MLRIEAVSKDIEKSVERVLRAVFMSDLGRTNRRDSQELMAEVFTHLVGDGKPVSIGVRGTQQGFRGEDPRRDVHLRGSEEHRSVRHTDADALL